MNRYFQGTWAVLHATAAYLAAMAVLGHVASAAYHFRNWRRKW